MEGLFKTSNDKGDILFMKKDGDPWKTEAAAKTAMTLQGWGDNTHLPVELPDSRGWALKQIRDPEQYKPKAPKKEPEKYYRVRFNGKARPDDYDDVILSVNGETLVIQREKEVIVPGRFKECADHAMYQVFRQRPGEDRKVAGTVSVFPYSLLGEASEKDWLEFKTAGDKKQKENIKRYGYNLDPEKIADEATV